MQRIDLDQKVSAPPEYRAPITVVPVNLRGAHADICGAPSARAALYALGPLEKILLIAVEQRPAFGATASLEPRQLKVGCPPKPRAFMSSR